MKIIITVRHPGPAEAVIPTLKWIDREFDRVVLVFSGKAIEFIKNNFAQDVAGREVYLNFGDTWEKCRFDNNMQLPDKLCEFDDLQSVEFRKLIDEMEEILKKEKPDVILRTTPAVDVGIDEAITYAAGRLDILEKLRCYQECYDCGKVLEELTFPMAVVDYIAKERMACKGIKCMVVGWMNQGGFLKYRNYKDARFVARNKLGLKDSDSAYLYCMIASGDFESEKKHFQYFLKCIGQKRFWILFHPRNTEEQKSQYLLMLAGKDCQVVMDMQRDEVLSFPDFIISLGSAINIDALQYQIYSGCNETETISVYTYGNVTRKIFRKVFNEESQPFSEENRGSVLVHEKDYSRVISGAENINKKNLYSQALQLFGGDTQQVQEKFMEYLKA